MDTQENNQFCIYLHKNKINNKCYIGQTCQKPERRWSNGAGYKECPAFYHAIQKYGWDNFEHIILEDNLTQEEANQKEQEYIKQYDSIKNGYNIQAGGSNVSGKNNPFYGKHHTEETKQKMSLNHADVSGANNPMYGKHHTEEAKRKISEKRKGIYIKEKCGSYGRNNPVYCVELKQTFKNPQDAAEYIGKNRRSGGDRINRLKKENKNKYAGYTWIFISPDE